MSSGGSQGRSPSATETQNPPNACCPYCERLSSPAARIAMAHNLHSPKSKALDPTPYSPKSPNPETPSVLEFVFMPPPPSWTPTSTEQYCLLRKSILTHRHHNKQPGKLSKLCSLLGTPYISRSGFYIVVIQKFQILDNPSHTSPTHHGLWH